MLRNNSLFFGISYRRTQSCAHRLWNASTVNIHTLQSFRNMYF